MSEISRRRALKGAVALAAAGAFPVSSAFAKPVAAQTEKLLNAYYFRAHMYTAVPAHVRDDMERMAVLGTTHVTLAVLEQDFRAAHHNIERVCKEAARVGMKMLAVPSRWCGMFAGAPKVPSEFAAEYPETWMRKKNGEGIISGPSGPVCSVFHPKVRDYMFAMTRDLVTRFDIAGMIMDEPKKLHQVDYSDAARTAVGDTMTFDAQIDAKVAFFDEMGSRLKSARADARLDLFLHASNRPEWKERVAAMPTLDAFGCDGRPWDTGAAGERNWDRKCLFPDNLDAYIQMAKDARKQTLCLVENYDLPDRHLDLLDEGYPRVFEREIDHLIYYWYPRNVADPDAQMAVVSKHVRRYAERMVPAASQHS